ncbi:TMEM175 family protein [Lactococcus fujiensis]|uniref:TMEM175 family protein n=2 Tax=Lactococcus fujiensis TaxID=610251 RepID=UPI000BDF164C|nr:TMEM175 family protein [Lactococcus fujiensis]
MIDDQNNISSQEKSDIQHEDKKKLSISEKRKLKYYQKMSESNELSEARKELEDEFLQSHPRFAQMSDEERMYEMKKHAQEEDKIAKQKLRNHLEAFSDGIIAVIITIMLLEIPMPNGTGGYWTFMSAVGIFLVSFIVVANFWFNHHQTFAATEEVTESIIIQDFIFTGLLSLIPLLTKWAMVAPNAYSSLNYGIVLLLILVQQEALSYSITKERCKGKPKYFNFWRKIWMSRLSFTLIINIIITIIAVCFPLYGHWLFVVVPVFNFFFRMVSNRNQRNQFGDHVEGTMND